MARVYSELLASGWDLGGGTTILGTVPDGYRWVVKHVTAYFGAASTVPPTGFILVDDLNIPIWGVLAPYARSAYFHEYSGGQVLDTGDQIKYQSFDTGWSVRVSGYALSLP